MTNPLFVPSETIDPTKDYFPDLVGEGKKYATQSDLARGNIEANLHIANLQKNQEELRQDLARRIAIEEALTRLSTNNANPATQPNAGQPAAGGTAQELTAFKPEDIAKLVQDEIAKKDTERTAQANVEYVQQELTKLWGKDLTANLQARAQVLGVTEDYILQMARTQPKVLLTLVTPVTQTAKPSSSLFSPTQAGISSAALTSSNAGKKPDGESYSYWKELRTANPTLYHSVEGTKARHTAAIKHGPDFYDN